jgi:predicted RNA-binding Zn-ribbon protein involved in translation (DUF1610 family)
MRGVVADGPSLAAELMKIASKTTQGGLQRKTNFTCPLHGNDKVWYRIILCRQYRTLHIAYWSITCLLLQLGLD